MLQLPEWSSPMFTLEDLKSIILGPTPKYKTIQQVTYPARRHLSSQLSGTVLNPAIFILTQFANNILKGKNRTTFMSVHLMSFNFSMNFLRPGPSSPHLGQGLGTSFTV